MKFPAISAAAAGAEASTPALAAAGVQDGPCEGPAQESTASTPGAGADDVGLRDLGRVEGPEGAQPRPGPARRRAPRRRRRGRAPRVVVAVLRRGRRRRRRAAAAAARAAPPPSPEEELYAGEDARAVAAFCGGEEHEGADRADAARDEQ